MCLPSHCLYFPLLGGSNLINSFTLKGSANDCECVELAVRPNPPKLHGWERKTSRCLKKKIGSYQEGEWLLRKLIKTNTLSDLFYYGNPPFFFLSCFRYQFELGFLSLLLRSSITVMKGAFSRVGRWGLWFSWVADELNDLGQCHFTSVVLAFFFCKMGLDIEVY